MPIVERKKIVDFGQGPKEVTEVGFRTGAEHWNEYLIDDGTVVRIKLVATEVLRVDGEYDPQGNPVYIVASTNVTAVSAPQEKRRSD